MRTLAVDFGEKRIGLAVSDPNGRIAFPLTTLRRTSDRKSVQEISDIIQREGVTRLIVGEPVNIDGSRGPAARRAARFAKKLQAESGLPCALVDERLSSVEARQKLREAGVDTRRYPEKVDAAAAQILLQQYLDEQPKEVDEDD